MYHLSILNPEFFLSRQTRQPPRAAQNWKNFAKLRKTQLSICGLWQLHWRTASVLSQETSHCLGGARAQGPEVKFCWNLGDSGLQVCGVSSQVFVEDVLYWDANCLNADLPTQRIAQIPVPMVTSQHLVESNYTQFSVKRIVLWSVWSQETLACPKICRTCWIFCLSPQNLGSFVDASCSLLAPCFSR